MRGRGAAVPWERSCLSLKPGTATGSVQVLRKMQAGPTARTRVRGARKYIVTAEVVAFNEHGPEQKEAGVNARVRSGSRVRTRPARSCGRGLVPLCCRVRSATCS